jgi:hypothetical protein
VHNEGWGKSGFASNRINIRDFLIAPFLRLDFNTDSMSSC